MSGLNRRALVGLIAGAVVMFGFGILWLLLGLSQSALPVWFFILVAGAGAALAVAIAVLRLRVSRLPRDAIAPSAQEIVADRAIGRRFGLVFGIEAGAIFLAVVGLNAVHLPEYIPCAVALIVGVHFFPLARLFKAPVYYVTGALGCAIALAGCVVRDTGLRQEAVGLSFGLLLWATAARITKIGFSAVRRTANDSPEP